MARTLSTSPDRRAMPRSAQSRRSSRSSTVRPSSSATERSTERGTAMSTMSMGAAARLFAATSWRVTTLWPDAVHATTTSAWASASPTRSSPMAATADASGEVAAALGRAVAHGDRSGAGLVQRGGDADAHLAGPDDEHVAAVEGAEPIAHHLDGGVADRRRAAADRGLAAGPLADAQGVAEEEVERGAHPTLVLGDLPRRAHLTEDLALAEDGRVEPGGDLEEVLRGGLVVLAVEVRVQLVGAQRAELAHEVADVGVGTVEALGDGVDLGAVARAEDGDLAEVVASGEAEDRLGDVRRGRSSTAPGPTAVRCDG